MCLELEATILLTPYICSETDLLTFRDSFLQVNKELGIPADQVNIITPTLSLVFSFCLGLSITTYNNLETMVTGICGILNNAHGTTIDSMTFRTLEILHRLIIEIVLKILIKDGCPL